MPILEIRNGGMVQCDLFNRMILTNIHKLQRSLETGNGSEEIKKDDDSTAALNGKQNCRVPVVNSFFPFSITDCDDDISRDLNEILISSSDVLTEGSVFEFD
jgi:hypothetical protein